MPGDGGVALVRKLDRGHQVVTRVMVMVIVTDQRNSGQSVIATARADN